MLVTPHILNIFFCFENKRLLEPALKDVIETSLSVSDDPQILDHLGSCSKSLASWCRELLMVFKSGISDCKRRIEMLKDQDSPATLAGYGEVKSKFLNLLAQKEVHWKQRAKNSG